MLTCRTQRRNAPPAYVLCSALALAPAVLAALPRARAEFKLPDIPGYALMRCDLHIHTAFSDGNVWPPVRAEEALRDGLDAFAITDHVEYLPHKDDLGQNLNRSIELALPHAQTLNIPVVRGAEITRDMPPGHFNVLFVKDNSRLATKEWRDSLAAAMEQGAFIVWNHPPFPQPEGKSVWYPEHTELLEKGWLHGIEVVNGPDYYPEAHRWCLEKKLTMLGSTDIHDPVDLLYDAARGVFRPMTLALVTEKSVEGIKEALRNRRTVVYADDRLIGEEQYLKPLFDRSIQVLTGPIALKEKGSALVQIRNPTSVTFELMLAEPLSDFQVPERLSLERERTVLLSIRAKGPAAPAKDLSLPYRVTNLLVAPGEGLRAGIPITVTVVKP